MVSGVHLPGEFHGLFGFASRHADTASWEFMQAVVMLDFGVICRTANNIVNTQIANGEVLPRS
jgi:predicted methyltransferase